MIIRGQVLIMVALPFMISGLSAQTGKMQEILREVKEIQGSQELQIEKFPALRKKFADAIQPFITEGGAYTEGNGCDVLVVFSPGFEKDENRSLFIDRFLPSLKELRFSELMFVSGRMIKAEVTILSNPDSFMGF